MTVKEALEAGLTDLEVSDNLITKVMLDNEVDGTVNYAKDDHQEAVDICRRDIYLILASSPEIREGSFAIRYSAGQLIALAKAINRKYGLEEATVSGVSKW